jgi:hypothetical protein
MNTVKQVIGSLLGKKDEPKSLPILKTPEEILREAKKETLQSKREALIRENLPRVKEFFSGKDAIPTRQNVLNRNSARLEKIAQFVQSGEKPEISLTYQCPISSPVPFALFVIRREIEDILKSLKEFNIEISEIEKGYFACQFLGKGKWTEEEIKALPLNWLNNAVIYYGEINDRSDSERDKAKNKILTLNELAKVLEMLEENKLPDVPNWYLE